MNSEKWIKEQIEKTQTELKNLQENLTKEQQIVWQLQISIIGKQGRLGALQEVLEKAKKKE